MITKFVHTLTPHESYSLVTRDGYDTNNILGAQFVLGATVDQEDGMHLYGSLDNVTFFRMYNGFTATKLVEASDFDFDQVRYIYAANADFDPGSDNVATLAQLEGGDAYAGASVLQLFIQGNP